ncbi:MAG: NifU family protein [Chlorobi bacterium]|nr:NifU family protein [Chlorobiota bacterium]
MDIESKREKIELVLESIRPYLRKDNGDIELVRVGEDGIADVRFLGECARCSLSIMTLRAGVEKAVLSQVQGIRRIEAVP